MISSTATCQRQHSTSTPTNATRLPGTLSTVSMVASDLDRKARRQSYEETKDDYHAIVYAVSKKATEEAWNKLEWKWSKRCPVMVTSLKDSGSELLAFFGFPEKQWKTLRTTNVIERINEYFRRRVKTQSSLPNDDAAGGLLFGLVANGQIELRRIDGYASLVDLVRKANDKTTTVRSRNFGGLW